MNYLFTTCYLSKRKGLFDPIPQLSGHKGHSATMALMAKPLKVLFFSIFCSSKLKTGIQHTTRNSGLG